MSVLDATPSLSPVQFFAIGADCHFFQGQLQCKQLFLLPSTADLLGEASFADVYAGWNEDVLALYFVVNTPFQKVGMPDFRKGDSVEVFIDTRAMKTKSGLSRFCHHFVFFPALTQDVYGKEVTRFRDEDTHPLSDPTELRVQSTVTSKGYELRIEIPSHCLFGFDPSNFKKLGFTYRVNRTENTAQHFSVSSEEYTIEQHPATWGVLHLHQT